MRLDCPACGGELFAYPQGARFFTVRCGSCAFYSDLRAAPRKDGKTWQDAFLLEWEGPHGKPDDASA